MRRWLKRLSKIIHVKHSAQCLAPSAQCMLTSIINMILEGLPRPSVFIDSPSDNLFHLMCCSLDCLKSELNMVVSSDSFIMYYSQEEKTHISILEILTQSKHPINGSTITIILLL